MTGPTVDVDVTRAGAETVRYELELSDLDGVNRLWVVTGGAGVVNATGLEPAASGGRTRHAWTGGATAELVLSVPMDRDGGNTGETAMGDDWAFGPVPFVEIQWAAGGTIDRGWPLTERAGNLAAADGEFGDRYALVGSADVVTRAATDRSVRVVVPAGTSPRADPAAIAEAVADAGTALDVGDRDDDVRAYAVPGVRRGGESVPARDEFWVNADVRLDSPENVLFHEYVHTRQSFDLARGMRWFREASAEYYAARLSYEQGRIDRRAMHDHLDGDPSTATLTAPDTWESSDVPHRKGARVLAVLDRKIRAETHGHSSLEDAFRRLNRHDGPVTYAVFRQVVGEVAGTSMDGWLDRHVAGSDPVADAYPRASPFTGATLLSGDPASPGSSPATAFFMVSVAFSVLAAGPLYELLRRVERRERTALASDSSGSR